MPAGVYCWDLRIEKMLVEYILVSILLVASAIPELAQAQTSLVTDRPDFVESSSTVDQGVLQIEGSFATDRKRNAGRTVSGWSTPFLFRLGVLSNVEARLESDWYTRTNGESQANSSTEGGFSDISVGIKWAFATEEEGAGKPSMAALVHADLPTGSREFTDSGARPSLRLSAEWSVHMPWEDPNVTDADWGVGVMPGIMIDRNELNESYFSGILGFVISKGVLVPALRVFTEIGFEKIQSVQNGGNFGFVQSGGTYLINPSWQLDAALAYGITDSAADLGFTIGLSGFLRD